MKGSVLGSSQSSNQNDPSRCPGSISRPFERPSCTIKLFFERVSCTLTWPRKIAAMIPGHYRGAPTRGVRLWDFCFHRGEGSAISMTSAPPGNARCVSKCSSLWHRAVSILCVSGGNVQLGYLCLTPENVKSAWGAPRGSVRVRYTHTGPPAASGGKCPASLLDVN
jgi:hypothetical protein